MRTTLLFITLFSGLLFSVNTIQAQCGSQATVCLPDCPIDNWSAYQTHIANISATCQLKITYATRFACNQWHDYYLAGVEVISSGAGCPFNTNDISAVAEQGMNALLMDNPGQFPPLPNQAPRCEENWRAGLGVCWEKNGGCYEPCTPSPCSLTAFKVCIDAMGVKTVTKLGTITAPEPNCQLPCVKVELTGE